MLELLRGVSVPNYLVTNIITNASIVNNPYKYVILRERSSMTVNQQLTDLGNSTLNHNTEVFYMISIFKLDMLHHFLNLQRSEIQRTRPFPHSVSSSPPPAALLAVPARPSARRGPITPKPWESLDFGEFGGSGSLSLCARTLAMTIFVSTRLRCW